MADRTNLRYATQDHVLGYVVSADGILIPLCDRRGEPHAWALIDADDLERVWLWRWHLSPGGYALRSQRDGESRNIWMHRELCPTTAPEVDHINHNRLDNRRVNLRPCGRAGNAQNLNALGGSSKYRGVSFNKRRGKWIAQARRNGKNVALGYFVDELDAAHAAQAFRDQHMPFAEREQIP